MKTEPRKFLPSFRGLYPKLYFHISNNYDGDSFSNKLYNYVHKLPNGKKCLVCGGPTKFKHYAFGYQPYCGKKCSAKDRYAREGNPMKDESARKKLSKSMKDYHQHQKDKQKKIEDTLGVQFHIDNIDFESIQIKNMVKNIIDKHPCHYTTVVRKRRNDLYQYIADNVIGDSFKEKLYIYINNLQIKPTCANIHCNKDSLFKNIKVGYSKYCSLGCAANETMNHSTPEQIVIESTNTENELVDYIKSIYNDNIITDNDFVVYLPDMDMGIDLYKISTHSYNQKETKAEKNRHLEKLNKANEAGIKLIQIFENEWIYKNEIVKSRIRALLGKANRIFARKCTIKKLDNTESKKFFNKTHIQGHVAGTAYGLVYENNIVAAMSFRKPRFNKTVQYELLRYSTMLNSTVVGGASRLLTAFVREHNPTSMVSYADRRYSANGGVYDKLGFALDGITKPNYFYVKDSILYSRLKFQKHKLPKLLNTFDKDITESENMFANGYRRIWDCGNYRFIKSFKFSQK